MSRHQDGNVSAVAIGFDQAHAEYRVAKSSKARSRARGVNFMGSGADYHYRSEADYLRIMELARDTDRHDQVVGQGVNRLVDMIFRDGMLCDPMTGNEDLDKILADDWRKWSSDRDACDISGKLSLHALARMAARHRVIDGDMQVLLLKSGHLQAVEGHRLRTPRNAINKRRKDKVVHGVVMDRHRRPYEYWFTKDDIAVNTTVDRVSDMVKVPAYTKDADGKKHRNVLHIFQPDRVSQTRGVSALARIMETAGQHDDLQWATLVKAQTAACFAILLEQAADKTLPTMGAQLGERSTETSADGFVKIMDQIAPGMVYRGGPGEKLQGYAPNVPNESFFQHSRLILTFIAINLGIPVMVLLLDPSETNFSGWRGAMDAAKVSFRRFRLEMVEQFYRPIYEWRVRRILARNPEAAALALEEGVDPFRHEWKPPYDPYIEPLKDGMADKLLVDEGLDSRRNVLMRRGLDIEEIDRARIADQRRVITMAVETAQEMAEDFPDAGVSWRDLIGGREVVETKGGKEATPTPEGLIEEEEQAHEPNEEDGNA